MTRLFNRSEDIVKRRALRSSLAPAEAMLWTHLRGRQLLGLKFRRQYGVGRYVVDFFCPALKLAIEVDGASHIGLEAELYDQARQQWIEQFGIRFLRFTDTDVLRYTEAVLNQISQVAIERGAVDAGGDA